MYKLPASDFSPYGYVTTKKIMKRYISLHLTEGYWTCHFHKYEFVGSHENDAITHEVAMCYICPILTALKKP